MENLPKISELQQLKNQLANVKETSKERLFFENKREEIEQRIFQLREKRDIYLFDKKTEKRAETEELIETLKVQLGDIDHKLDYIDEDAHPSVTQIQEKLINLIFEKSDSAKQHCEKIWREIEQIESALSTLNGVSELINDVQLGIQKVLGTIDLARERSILHYIFGKSPYIIVTKQLTELKKVSKKTLSELEPYKEKLGLDSLPYKSLIEEISTDVPDQWSFSELTKWLSPISHRLDEELNLLLEKHLKAEESLKEQEQSFQHWLETEVENL